MFRSKSLRLGQSSSLEIARSAVLHGHDLLRQGFTVSQVVRGYGDVCQSITELAVERDAPISTRHIIFTAVRDVPNLFRLAVDGTGTEERLTTSDRQQRADAISPDGKRLVFEELTPPSTYDLMLLALDGPSTSPRTSAPRTRPLLDTPFDERNAAISPDGRWMAYESNESARSQIYVPPFPNVADAHYQISTEGGRTPVWASNGRELFFVNGSALMVVEVQATPTFSAGNATTLFEEQSIFLDGRNMGSGTGRTYDVSHDGQRFLMIKESAGGTQSAPPGLVVVQNWTEELKRLVPAR
jgi:Tol biopolymer transport system component